MAPSDMQPLPERPSLFLFFFFNDTATTEIYTLSLHDALPISAPSSTTRVARGSRWSRCETSAWTRARASTRDRKSTRLNSSHVRISYAVFCLKKKKVSHPTRPTCEASDLDRLRRQPTTIGALY